MIDRLDNVAKIIDWYETADLSHIEEINKALKALCSHLYHLEVERALYHDKFQNIIYNLTKKSMTVSRAENEAHIEVPEMYMLRRVMNAAYRCADSMRTNISFMKSEQNNT